VNNFLLLLSSVGICLILKYGFIFEALKNTFKHIAFKINNIFGVYVEKLLSCSQCLGFWTGFILFLLSNILEHEYNLIIFYSVLFGFISSFISNIIDMLMMFLDEKIYELQLKNESKIKKN
jgi:ABC-type dipeptide/oligopeptide/nickel transport system permease component